MKRLILILLIITSCVKDNDVITTEELVSTELKTRQIARFWPNYDSTDGGLTFFLNSTYHNERPYSDTWDKRRGLSMYTLITAISNEQVFVEGNGNFSNETVPLYKDPGGFYFIFILYDEEIGDVQLSTESNPEKILLPIKQGAIYENINL